jgi:hypothetical protein
MTNNLSIGLQVEILEAKSPNTEVLPEKEESGRKGL